MNTLDITILCKVVDNYGDIGFVYRLARRLKELSSSINLRLVVSDLHSFALLNPLINPTLSFQRVDNYDVFDWNDSEVCTKEFLKNFPSLILECFQCNRPLWLENILFPDKNQKNNNPICNIINLDYLTAEDYAETFHCLQSLTRSSKVKKINFMGGFTNKTAGLILDNNFMQSRNKSIKGSTSDIKILFFTYEKDFYPFFETFNKTNKKIFIDIAQGRGKSKFLDDFKKYKKESNDLSINIFELDFLSQTQWDSNLFNYNIIFIRGEDSLSRAVLSGIPFIWHAYVQEEDYQLVKVQALLDKMRNFFTKDDFFAIENFYLSFNTSLSPVDNDKMKKNLLYILKNLKSIKKGFWDFSQSLIKNGDFATHLLQFIESNY